MSNPNTGEPDELSKRVRTAREQFERLWNAGMKPRIEEYLDLFHPSERSFALEALSQLQQQLILQDITAQVSPPTFQASTITTGVEPPRLTSAVVSPFSEGSGEGGTQPIVTFDVIEGPHSGLKYTFERHDTLIAGRSLQSQLLLQRDLHFSRFHFRLEINPPSCFIMDLNSTNGTFVNGERISERFLSHGDIVSGGRTKMVVSILSDLNLKSPIADNKAANLGVASASESNSLSAADKSAGMCASRSEMPKVAGYVLLKQIGTGDLGTVYQAWRVSDGLRCALKVMSPASHSDEASVQAFLREGKILTQLDHPNIIRLLEMGYSGDQIFVATEYVASVSWEALIPKLSSEKRISLACGLIVQVLDALGYAHASGMVHRDVKPKNILISKTQNKLKAKLADFGLAKEYANAGMSQVTRDGAVLGSLPFMSPDQFLNSREARPTCDIYSAGASLYWMLTGKEPIQLEGHPCKFLAILEEKPTPIQSHNPTVPNALAAVIHKAIQKTPEQRWSTAAQMQEKLKSFV